MTEGRFTLDENWTLSLRTDLEPDVVHTLECTGIFPTNTGITTTFPVLVYLFSASLCDGDPQRQLSPVQNLPTNCREMLLFSPMVPLLKTARGFQAISGDAWTELVARDESLSGDSTCNASAIDARHADEEADESDSTQTDSESPVAQLLLPPDGGVGAAGHDDADRDDICSTGSRDVGPVDATELSL